MFEIFKNYYGYEDNPSITENLTEEQKTALNILESGENVFLTGGAGTGKSYLINVFRKLNANKNILVTAPTGVAAQNVEGATLHRTFKIPSVMLAPREPQKNTKAIMRLLSEVDILIIDEISMCRADIFTYVIRFIAHENKRREGLTRNPKAPIQLIVVGDFFQLPPVITNKEREAWNELWGESEGFAFTSGAWKYMHIRTIELTEVIRQKNADFAHALNKIRVNDRNGIDYLNAHRRDTVDPDAIYLCCTNKAADEINYQKLMEIEGEEKDFEMTFEGDKASIKKSDYVCEEILTLKIGARVMILVNDPLENYSNGSCGVVKAFTTEGVLVKLDTGKTVEIKPYKWSINEYALCKDGSGRTTVSAEEIASYKQLPLKLGYAITIHKSQGQTYDAVNVDVRDIFANGQLYVALSRCRSIENTYFNAPITVNKLRVSPTVLQQYAA
ncbi:ATP-dependent DNA helicase [Succinivibrio dextrinosolvens]|uniref:ATP-dependent DNA helicase n=1 Tax=Succinivibrio dextrinosolvens TaxID=83771 RepID=UPI00241E0227|nr:DEAD/DEAH box helicase [Succinivibrio dextrinosolvens]MBE6423024.1 hypothetical protein [Succinivibrio dextrinosolvens]